MEFLNHLEPQYVVFLKGKTKKDIITELAGLAFSNHLIEDQEDLVEKLNYREELMSTGIGLELGIPHVRYEHLKKPAIFLGIQPDTIPDYESMDNLPVKLIFMILVGAGEHKRHVTLLSQIVSLLKEDSLRERILGSEKPQEVYQILKEAAHG